MPRTGFVPIDAMPIDMTEAEHEELLERINNHGYENDVTRDEDGRPIDGDEYVLRGMRVISEVMLGE